MINVFILNEYPWQFYLLAVCTNVAKHLFHVKPVFCLPEEAFLVDLSSSLGGHTREQIFLVQKLAWLALEQDSLARKNCHVFAVHMQSKENFSRKLTHLYGILYSEERLTLKTLTLFKARFTLYRIAIGVGQIL